MKHFSSILFCFVFISSVAISQVKIPVGSKAEIAKFMKTTTYVVLKNDFMCDYNDEIREAVKAFWNITPVEFIKESEFNGKRNDETKSFLLINKVYFEQDKSNTKFDFLILSLGGKFKTVNDMPTLCAIPLCYSGDDEQKYLYKLGAMVKHCQTHIGICSSHPELTQENILDYYTSNSGDLSKMNLCLLKDDIAEELRTPAEIKAVYPHNFEICSKDKIREYISGDNEQTVIAHIISPLSSSELPFCVKIVINAKTGMLYYYDTQRLKKNHDGYILSTDLKKLANKK